MPDFLKLIRRTFATALCGIVATALCGADSSQTERVSAAYLLAAGRLPTTPEIAALREHSSLSVSELVVRLDEKFAEKASGREIARRAYVDCFGIEPSADQLVRSKGNYTAQLKHHLQELADQRERYGEVVQRAYLRVIRREPYLEEIAYWNRYDVIPFALLSAAVENWARRNQPGLMVTSGDATVSVNSGFLETVRLSPALASEVAEALGTPRTQDDSDRAHATARNVLTPGGAQLISNGGVPFVAAGK